MKRALLLVGAVMIAVTAFGQMPTKVTPETFRQNPDLAGGIYLTYRYTETPQPAIPAGYKPYYVSMVSRHASRWHTSPYRYVLVQKLLNEAASKGDLTPLGLHVQQVMDRVATNAAGRNSEISPTGKEEQRGIATRMYDTCKELFGANGAKIQSYSSDSHRCILTMSTFDLRLQQLNPSMLIDESCNGRVQQALRKHEGCVSIMDEAKGATLPRIRKALDSMADDVIGRLYKKGRCPFADDADKKADFVRCLSDLTIIQQCTESDRLDELFTPEEKFALWEQVNTYRYAQYGASLKWGDAILGDGMILVRMILEDANERIAGADRVACLRFGHDYSVLALVEAMEVNGECVRTDDLDNLKDVWVDFDHAPMSSNVQFIFYRNEKNDIIVKLMHDEKVMTLPIKSDIAPLYRWSDLKAFMEKRISYISSLPMVKVLNLEAPRQQKTEAFGMIESRYEN